MHRTHTGRPALRRLTIACTLALLGVATLVTALPAGAGAARAAPITVRIEGPKATLLPATAVTLSAGTIAKDGLSTDSCNSLSATGALELATRGAWTGTWSASFSAYFLTGIEGLAFPSTGAEYWAFWVNDAPASSGICGITPQPGDSVLFFPDCFGKTCPKSAGVLGVKAPQVAVVGRPVAVSVTAFADADGTPAPASGAIVTGGGARAQTGANGTARLTFAAPGRFVLRVHAPHAIRTETSICVQSTAAKMCH